MDILRESLQVEKYLIGARGAARGRETGREMERGKERQLLLILGGMTRGKVSQEEKKNETNKERAGN